MASAIVRRNSFSNSSEFRDFLEQASDNINKDVQKILKDNMPSIQEGSYCIATTGSDARREKLSRLSPFELMVIIDEQPERAGAASPSSQVKSPRYVELEAALSKIGLQFSKTFDPRFQFQDLQSNPLTYHSVTQSGTELHLTIPNRAVEATFLFGSQEVMDSYKKLTLQSLKTFNRTKRLHFEKQFLQKSLLALYSCVKNEDKKSVDLETGELHYDNDQLKSVKYIFMRPVQYKLISILIHAAKNNLLSEELFAQMPPRLDDRIIWMQKNNLLNLSIEEATDVSEAYARTLEWYLDSQNAYEKEVKTTKVDPQELNNIAQTIFSFANTPSKGASLTGK